MLCCNCGTDKQGSRCRKADTTWTSNDKDGNGKFKGPDNCEAINLYRLFKDNDMNIPHSPVPLTSSPLMEPVKPSDSQMTHVRIARAVTIGTNRDVIRSANLSIGARFVCPWRTTSMIFSSL